jgi:hypothetical protein
VEGLPSRLRVPAGRLGPGRFEGYVEEVNRGGQGACGIRSLRNKGLTTAEIHEQRYMGGRIPWKKHPLKEAYTG